MRELKFRVWVKDEGKYHLAGEGYNRSITLDGQYQLLLIGAGNGDFVRYRENPDNIVIEQYTGLKDKNGVEIYESDICKIWFDLDSVDEYLILGMKEIEIKTQTRIFLVGDLVFNNQPELNVDTENIEVIGNIHENPELLEANNE